MFHWIVQLVFSSKKSYLAYQPFKMISFKIFTCVVVLTSCEVVCSRKYEPNWESLDSRPLPSWFDEAKIGILMHWGVYSVPSFSSEFFWNSWASNDSSIMEYMKKYYGTNFVYPDFAKDFTAEFFDPNEWVEMFAASGAKYVILTGKHADGYTLWPSSYSSNWNAKDVGPARDLLGELAAAVRDKNLTFGVFYSLYEWFHPLYLKDKKNKFSTRDFVTSKMLPEMKEMVERYKPSIVWSNGYWDALDTYWGSTDFLAWLYNESPVKDFVVTDDKWGIGIPCRHGGFSSCNDRFDPDVVQHRKWEDLLSIDKKSWGYRRDAKLKDYLTNLELLSRVASAVSCGGNILINVGPTKDGIIAPIFQERLRDLGEWLKINGEAIYGTQPWSTQKDILTSGVWYTAKGEEVYAIVLFWPDGNVLELGSVLSLLKDKNTQISMLNTTAILKWAVNSNKARIVFPDKSSVLSKDAYVLKFHTGLEVEEPVPR